MTPLPLLGRVPHDYRRASERGGRLPGLRRAAHQAASIEREIAPYAEFLHREMLDRALI